MVTEWFRKARMAISDRVSNEDIIDPSDSWHIFLNPQQRIWLGVGTGSGQNRFFQACDEAFRQPLIEEIKLNEAFLIAFQVVGPKSLTLNDFNQMTGLIKNKVSRSAMLDTRISCDSSLAEDEVRLSVWAL